MIPGSLRPTTSYDTGRYDNSGLVDPGCMKITAGLFTTGLDPEPEWLPPLWTSYTHTPMSTETLEEILSLFSHGLCDQMTSQTSTFLYTSQSCKDFAAILESSRGGSKSLFLGAKPVTRIEATSQEDGSSVLETWIKRALKIDRICKHIPSSASEAQTGGADTGQASKTDKYDRDATIHELVRQLNKLFHDKARYTKFLESRDASVQWLLDFLQYLLDHDADIPPEDRCRIVKALIRLSNDSKLYPKCFLLTDLERERLVDGGSFSDVYQAYLRGQCVAVKMMRVFDQSDIDTAVKRFGREAIIWRQLSHPNLLPFYGLYKLRQRICLVSPWMENGHIHGFLKKHPCNRDRLLSLILDVARGLEHLHAMGIVHGDLKGDNIFVTPSLTACIADFGLSSITTSFRFTPSSQGRGGTVRYQAPELHRGGHNDLHSDIYSFACVVYQLLTGKAPFPDISFDGAVIIAVLEGCRPSRPPSCSSESDGLWALLQDCWQGTPAQRPTAAQIVQRLLGDEIGAADAQIRQNWDDLFTSKFRPRLLEQPFPSVVDFERMVFGTEAQLAPVAESLDAPETRLDTDPTFICEMPRLQGGIPEAHITAFAQGIHHFLAAGRSESKTPLHVLKSMAAIVDAMSSILEDMRAFAARPLHERFGDVILALRQCAERHLGELAVASTIAVTNTAIPSVRSLEALAGQLTATVMEIGQIVGVYTPGGESDYDWVGFKERALTPPPMFPVHSAARGVNF